MAILERPQPPKKEEPAPVVRAERRKTARRDWLLPLSLLIMPMLLLLLYDHAQFPGLTNLDALDFAQVGRNLSAGRGFVSYTLRPLALTHGSNPLHQPDVTLGPLYPFLLALAFGAAGARDAVVVGVSGLFYLLTIPLVYLLGLRVFSRTVGLITAGIVACNALILEYAASGMHITLYIFLATALFLVLYHLAVGSQDRAQSPGRALPTGALILAGILTGLLYLTDPVFFWIIPIILMFVLRLNAPRRLATTLKFLAPLGILVVPWMIRNGLVTGNPVFGLRGLELWMNTRQHYPGFLAYRLHPGEMATGPELLGAVLQKMLLGINTVLQALPQISASWILAFLLPCLFFGYTAPAANALRRVMLSCFLALLGGMLLFHVEMPLFVSLVPAMLIFAVAYLVHLLQQAQMPRASHRLVAALLGMAVAYPLASQMVLEDRIQRLPEEASARALGTWAQNQEVVFSDQPQVVAWYADRPSVLIPALDGRIADIRKQFTGTHWLFLTQQARSYSPEWQYLYDRFQGWNKLYLHAQASKMEAPASLQISGKGQPLFEALEGFTTVGPLPGASPSTVVAALPQQRLSLRSEQKGNTTP